MPYTSPSQAYGPVLSYSTSVFAVPEPTALPLTEVAAARTGTVPLPLPPSAGTRAAGLTRGGAGGAGTVPSTVRGPDATVRPPGCAAARVLGPAVGGLSAGPTSPSADRTAVARAVRTGLRRRCRRTAGARCRPARWRGWEHRCRMGTLHARRNIGEPTDTSTGPIGSGCPARPRSPATACSVPSAARPAPYVWPP